MTISGISTATFFGGLRQRVGLAKRELTTAQSEAVTGRLNDPGINLGSRNGLRMALEADVRQITIIAETSDFALAKLEASQAALQTMGEISQRLLPALTSSIGQGDNATAGLETARSSLSQLIVSINTTFNGAFVFGGINSSEPPVETYDGSTAQQAFDDAFQAHFGFPKNDPAAQQITPAAINDFVETVLPTSFTDAGWRANVSTAADAQIIARTGLSSSQTVSTSANSDGIQTLYLATVLASELMVGNLSPGTQDAMLEKAISLTASAGGLLARQQGEVGQMQSDLSRSIERNSTFQSVYQDQADRMVQVDQFEAATRVTALTTQLEASYTLTGRLQQMSLLRFL